MSVKTKKLFIIPLLLVFLLFVAACSETEDINQEYIEFKDGIINTLLSDNSLNTHFSLSDNKTDIDRSQVSLGHISSEAIATEKSTYDHALQYMSEMNRSKLTSDNQYSFDRLEAFLRNSSDLLEYPFKYEPLSAYSGEHIHLPLLFSEYRISSETDIENYFKICEALPSYFREIISYEQLKKENMEFMSSNNLENLIDFCNSFTSANTKEHFLQKAFEKNIAELNLEAEKTAQYNNRHETLLKNILYPAYKELSAEMDKIAADATYNNLGMCKRKDGRSYYEILIRSRTGDSTPVENMGQILEKDLNYYSNELADILTSAPSLQELILQSNLSENLDKEITLDTSNEYLHQLKLLADSSFIESDSIDYSIEYMEPAISEYFSNAYFFLPPTDDLSGPEIFINPNNQFTAFDLFTTLAHEGYPGHMLQTLLQKDKLETRLFSCLGYCEGWACYSELYSYPYAISALDLAGDFELAQVNTVISTYRKLSLCLYALLDYNINYRYWTVDDTGILLTTFGISNMDTIEGIFNYIVNEPANYMTYYMGYRNVATLKNEYLENGHSEKEFHKAFLACPEAPFDVVRNKLMLKQAD